MWIRPVCAGYGIHRRRLPGAKVAASSQPSKAFHDMLPNINKYVDQPHVVLRNHGYGRLGSATNDPTLATWACSSTKVELTVRRSSRDGLSHSDDVIFPCLTIG